MASSVNKVILVGNLGKDPEVRHNPEGGKIVTFSLATSESWKDKNSGEKREKTEWHRIVIFNEKIAEVVERYVKKGSKVYLEGQLQTRKWTDQQGQEKYTTEVVLQRYRGELTMLDSKGSGDSSYGDSYSSGGSFDTSPLGSASSGSYDGSSSGFSAAPSTGGAQRFDTLNDDMPF